MHPAQSNPVPELRTDPVTLSMYILAEQHIKARAPALCTEPPARFACVSKMSTRPCRPRTRAGASASCSTPSVSPASSWRPQFARRAVVPGFTNHVAACVLPLLSFVGNAGRAGGCPGDGRFVQCAGARAAHAARVPLRMQPGTVCSAGCQAQGEDQKKLDILANEVFINLLTKCGQCAVLVSGPPPPGPPSRRPPSQWQPGQPVRQRARSARRTTSRPWWMRRAAATTAWFSTRWCRARRRALLPSTAWRDQAGPTRCARRQDGSSNIDCGVSIGTIFGIYKREEGCEADVSCVLRVSPRHPGGLRAPARSSCGWGRQLRARTALKQACAAAAGA